ncbi:MAG: DUF72 domain-containing protein [Chloroflexi bacterium]|nr:DUF72 domain-containing protein [Chloroflexota bacterium]
MAVFPGELHIGCGGFPVTRAEYYRHFSAVEVRQTFYKPPTLATAQRWRDAMYSVDTLRLQALIERP